MTGIIAIVGFAVAMFALNRVLRRLQQDGNFDAGPSSAARPGMRWFFDFGDDGHRQRPPQR